MKRRCPNLTCQQSILYEKLSPKTRRVIKKGTYYRRCDRRRITRYHCTECNSNFSSATFDSNYRQKKRELNQAVYELLCSGVSQRRLACVLKVNPKTVVRKFKLLSAQARTQHQVWREELAKDRVVSVQFDDLETSEHTKCKPLSVTLAVNKKTREILGFQVSRMPAKGHLAKISVNKYGLRRDERSKGWDQFFTDLKPCVSSSAVFESDENPHYGKYVKRHFGDSTHVTYKGARGAVVGQGELKKLKRDPLFSLNHTCAMLRANLNRLFRRTWCTTKTVQGLIDHLSLYVTYHNFVILPRLRTINGGS